MADSILYQMSTLSILVPQEINTTILRLAGRLMHQLFFLELQFKAQWMEVLD